MKRPRCHPGPVARSNSNWLLLCPTPQAGSATLANWLLYPTLQAGSGTLGVEFYSKSKSKIALEQAEGARQSDGTMRLMFGEMAKQRVETNAASGAH